MIAFLLALTMAMFAGCSSQKKISNGKLERQQLWVQELKDKKITQSEYFDLIEAEKELEQIEKLAHQK